MSVSLSVVLAEGLYGLLQCPGKYHKSVNVGDKALRQMKSSSAVFREHIEECASICVIFLWGASNLLWWEKKTLQ